MDSLTVAYRQRDVDRARCTLSRWMTSSLHSESNLGDAGLLFFIAYITEYKKTAFSVKEKAVYL